MMSYRVDKQVIDTHTDTGNDNTRRPKLASGNETEKAQVTWVQRWGKLLDTR